MLQAYAIALAGARALDIPALRVHPDRVLRLPAAVCLLLVACGDSGTDTGDFEQVDGLPEVFSYGTVWSFAPDDVWVTADGGRVLHYDGSAWDETDLETSELFLGAWGFAPDDLWLVGGETLARYDGSDWTLTDLREENAGIEGLTAIWGSAPDDVWVVGTQSTAAHFDGASWQRHIAAGTENTAVWGSGPEDVYVVGLFDVERWNGSDFEPVDSDLFSAEGVWGSAPDDVWLADGSGEVAHFDGSDWSVSEVGLLGGPSTLWGRGSDDLWGVGSFGAVFHHDGGGWRTVSQQRIGSPYLRVFNRVHGSDQGDVWILGTQSGDQGVTPLLWRHAP